MKILATGASGFIGTNFVAAALKAGHEVVNADPVAPFDRAHERHWRKADIMDRDGLTRLFQDVRPDAVVHLAARTDCDENTTVEKGYQLNTTGTANVLAATKATDSVQRIVVTSTQFVFNKGPELPKGDEDYSPRTVYGYSKIETERLTRSAGLGCAWTIVRPTNVWGPWSTRHVDTFFKAVNNGRYLHPGRKPCRRSYGYVGNVADQILRVLDAPRAAVDGRVLYVGDAPVNLLDWANAFARRLTGRDVRVAPRWMVCAMAKVGDAVTGLTGKRFPIDSTRYDSMTEDYLTPMDRTFAVLGPPRYTVEEGMDQTIEWLAGYAPHLCPASVTPSPAAAPASAA